MDKVYISPIADLLHLLRLAAHDGAEERACALLRYAFGIAIPANCKIDGKTREWAYWIFTGSKELIVNEQQHSQLWQVNRSTILGRRQALGRIFLRALETGMLHLGAMLAANPEETAYERIDCQSVVLVAGLGFPVDPTEAILLHEPFPLVEEGSGKLLWPSSTKGSFKFYAQLYRQLLPSYLMVAIAMGREAIVRILLRRTGKRIKAHGWAGLDALLLASMLPVEPTSDAMVRTILSFGLLNEGNCSVALGQIERLLAGKQGWPAAITAADELGPIDFACARGHHQVVMALVGSGSFQVLSSSHCLLVQSDLDLTIRLIQQARIEASRRHENGDLLVASWIESMQDSQGSSPLHLAMARNSQSSMDLASILLHHCPQLLDKTNHRGSTALHEAARSGSTETMRLLIQAGADCALLEKTSLNQPGLTALEVARRRGIPSEDLFELFAQPSNANIVLSASLQALLREHDSTRLQDDLQRQPSIRKGRFLIERLLSLPKQWLQRESVSTAGSPPKTSRFLKVFLDNGMISDNRPLLQQHQQSERATSPS